MLLRREATPPGFLVLEIMTHNVQLITRDGEQLSFECADGQTLIEAANAARISLPAQCKKGSCGACSATINHGSYILGEHNPAVLPSGSKGRGNVLLCRTMAYSDLVVALPYDYSRISFQSIARRSAEILALDEVAENTVRLQLKLDSDDEHGGGAEFEPGQFMELEVPGSDERRAYSLANTPNWDGTLEFLIRLQPQGIFSSFLKERASCGMRLMVRGPLGAFGLNQSSLKPRWFIAGGTGLAPVLSMLRRMAEYDDLLDTRLIFGVNRESELFALDVLEGLKAQLPQLSVDICVWHPVGDWHGEGKFIGTPADCLRHNLAEGVDSPDIYVCGPSPLLDAVEQAATETGFSERAVHRERFAAA